MNKHILFLDHQIVPSSKKFQKKLSPGVLSGKGAFETMRAYDGKIFAFLRHFKRLRKALKLQGMRMPLSFEAISRQTRAILQKNKFKNARVRLTVWQRKKCTHLAIVACPYRGHSGEKYRKGFNAVLLKEKRKPDAIRPDVKSINYAPLVSARERARACGSDEAIFINRQGYLSEGSYTNLFFVSNSKLFTPSLSCGCLKGITRQIVIELAKTLNISCRQVYAKAQALFDAEEAFVTNSLLEIMPLTCVQGKVIGRGAAGPLTKKIQKAYRALVRKKSENNGNS